MERMGAWLAARLYYQYFFGAALWLGLLGLIVQNRGIYQDNGLLFGLDYVPFYTAGRFVLEGRADELYGQSFAAAQREPPFGFDEGRLMPFLNPPFFALLVAPLALMPFEPSLAAWTALSLAVLGLGLVGLEGRLRLGTLAAVLCYFPAWYALRNGQNSLITAGLFGISYGLLRGGRPFAAGLVASLMLYKPHLLLGLGMVWLFQARRCWPALAGMGCGGTLLVGLTLWLLPGSLPAYAEVSRTMLANLVYQPGYPTYTQHSVPGLVLTLLPGQRGLAEGAQAAAWILGGGGLWWFCRRQQSLPLTYAAAVAGGACLAPYVQLYDWSILVVPALLLWHHDESHRDFWILAFLAVWLVALLSRFILRAQVDLLSVGIHVPYLVFLAVTLVGLRRAATVRSESET